jgi:hypothetical protein
VPAAELEPDRNRARRGQQRHEHVAGESARAAGGKPEQVEQEGGGEHARVVLQDRERVAEAAGERRVRPGRASESRVDARQQRAERGERDHCAAGERELSRG